MTDSNDFISAYQRYQEALPKANAHNKTAVLDALALAGVSRVNVTFDGEGDSGQIENIAAFVGDAAATLPPISVCLQKVSSDSAVLATYQVPLQEAIEEVCYGLLEETNGGWENNDGAFGEFQFNTANRTITLEFNQRFSDFLSTSHEW